ncbi:hypothetical protein T439DRAFT_379799 [Meredithblackwellia eburnea MCA 4105]
MLTVKQARQQNTKKNNNNNNKENISNQPLSVSKTTNSKGKQKAKQQEQQEQHAQFVECWKDSIALVGLSFNMHKLSQMNDFPITPTTYNPSFETLETSLKVYLDRQIQIDDSLGPDFIARVQAGFVSCELHRSSRASQLPILIEVERTSPNDDSTTSISTFILLPPSSSHPNPSSATYPLLLSRSSPTSLTTSIINFFSTRFDTFITPFWVPPSATLTLLETLVKNRHPASTTPTSLTLAFPESIASEGLSTLTLTLPPTLVDSLQAASLSELDSTANSSLSDRRQHELHDGTGNGSSSSFVAALSTYFKSVTSIDLTQLHLVRFGGGRGTFLHSGYSGGGADGAKLKFYTSASEDLELEKVLEELVILAQGKN